MRGHDIRDFEASASMWADERVVRFITRKPSTRAQAWSRLLLYMGHWQAVSYGYWVVEDRETGAFLGEVGFADFKREITPPLDGIPEAGWALVPEAHGRGIATEAVMAALQWADHHIAGSHTVCLFDPEHEASLRVAEKAGYIRRGDAVYLGNPTLIMQRAKPSS